MPSPGSPPVHKKPKVATVKEFVRGESPPVEPTVSWAQSLVLETAIKLIKQWAPRQILKILTAVTAAVGGSMMAEGHTLEAATTFFLGLLIGLVEMLTSKLSKVRYQRKLAEAKAKS